MNLVIKNVCLFNPCLIFSVYTSVGAIFYHYFYYREAKNGIFV